MSGTLTRDLLDLSAGEIAATLASGKASALEVTDAAIARIEARDPAINAVVVRDFDRARTAARAADAALARDERHPLLGVPMTVKESHQVEGLPSTWGSPAFGGWIAPEDSVGVARLKAAGAIILGKTNVPPFLGDWQSANPVYGRTNNPYDLTRSPGGSSGGSAAALAAGMVPLEFGSDIGGSIRVPAAFCGVFGHKPSWNLIPVRGHQPPGMPAGAPMPLAVVGPMARTASDLQLALDVLAGPDSDMAGGYRVELPAPRHTRLADYRVLVLDHHPRTVTSAEVAAAVNTLAGRLDDAGVDVVRASDQLPDLMVLGQGYMDLLMVLLSRGDPSAETIDAHAYIALLDAQAGVRRQFAALFRDIDVIVCPAYGRTAFPHMEVGDPAAQMLEIDGRPTPYFDQMGWQSLALFGNLPSTVAPIGRSEGGLPIGAQIIGDFLADRTTIAFAGLIEREFGGYVAPTGY